MHALDVIGRSLEEGFFMFWETLWALVLGFGLSGVVQSFVSRREMQKVLGDHRPATLARTSLLGAASSSCSYAASALAKSLFARGADFTAAMVFMFASTNLVVELGIVLWLLLGWQFAVAEFVGGAIMIALLGLVVPRLIPAAWIESARRRLDRNDTVGQETDSGDTHGEPTDSALHEQPLRQRLRSPAGWADAAGYAMSDITMLRREMAVGYVIAGFLAIAVPSSVYQSVFLSGHGFWSSLENVVIGPFIAFISFVCSVGNVPLAAALWKGGISFGGVVSFVFADLIALPLVLIYRKFYGTRLALRLFGVFWLVMSVAGLATEYLFKGAGLVPNTRPVQIVPESIRWDHTTVLNVLALVIFAGIYWLHRNKTRYGGGNGYATDPVCGMQVETANSPATDSFQGRTHYFCSDRCQARFATDPQRFTTTEATEPMATGAAANIEDAVVDPVCGMGVPAAEPDARAEHDGMSYLFCSTHCRDTFLADPDLILRAVSAQADPAGTDNRQ